MTAARWFVVVILLLTIGTIVVPWYWRRYSAPISNYQPKLHVLVDGKAVGRDVVVRQHANEAGQDASHDRILPCSKGKCQVEPFDQTYNYTLEHLATKLTSQAVHSADVRKTLYQQTSVVWTVDVTDALKKFERNDYAITVDSAKRNAEQTDLLSIDSETIAPNPVTLGLSNVNPETVRLLALILVIAVVFFGYKFISVGGHSH